MVPMFEDSADWGWRPAAPLAAIAGACVLLSACSGDVVPLARMGEAQSCCETCIGCATEHNLTAVVAKLSDLEVPRKDAPRDAARRDAVLAAYRAGGGSNETNGLPRDAGARQ
jgi:type IV pilus biogenesis protein CpaD/CtpE